MKLKNDNGPCMHCGKPVILGRDGYRCIAIPGMVTCDRCQSTPEHRLLHLLADPNENNYARRD